MAEPAPLGDDDFAQLLGALLVRPAGLVIAVSGGPDSMALLQLVARLAARSALPPVTVATIDHGLRPNSERDADLVEAVATARGLPVSRLVWRGPKPASAIQEKARAARYDLLTTLCTERGADHLVTAHTLDDQAETVLLRLLRGSGLSGLAGMRDAVARGTVRHIRPLLAIPKARLVATCAAHGVPFHDDPSNVDPRFARARLRTLMPHLAAERCDARALSRLAARAARAETALAEAAATAGAAVALPAGQAMARLDAERLAALPGEIAIRVLGQVIAPNGDAMRRLDGLERLAARVITAAARGEPAHATFCGARLALGRDGVLVVRREGPRRRGVSPGVIARQSAPTPAAQAFSWQA